MLQPPEALLVPPRGPRQIRRTPQLRATQPLEVLNKQILMIVAPNIPELSRLFILRNHLSQVHGRPLPGYHDRQGQCQVCCSVVRGDGAKSGVGCLGFKRSSRKIKLKREFALRSALQNCEATPVLKSRDAPMFDDERAPVC